MAVYTKKDSGAPKIDPFQIITDKIIKMIEENGTLPWEKPWSTVDDFPRNLYTGKEYRGSNVFVLSVESLFMGYTDPYWVTFDQAKALKGSVRKGETSTVCVKWGFSKKKNKETGEEMGDSRPFHSVFRLFNSAQCEGLTIPTKEERVFTPVIECEAIGSKMGLSVDIKHGGNRAFYEKVQDYIMLPPREHFSDTSSYYSTRYHELVHATGSKKRLNRPTLVDAVEFGDQNYSKEELVAEMGAAVLCAATGIENTASMKNSVAYLSGWAQKLKEDKHLFTSAATQAHKAADYILGIVRETYADKAKEE